jgi:obg-like ATPase 1
LNEDESLLVKGLGLLTLKPLIYAANVSEDDLGNHGANNVHVQVGGILAQTAAVQGRRLM